MLPVLQHPVIAKFATNLPRLAGDVADPLGIYC